MQQFNVTHPANSVLAIVSGTIGAIGLPGNIFLMILIAMEYRKRKAYEWLLFLLALGDCILCLNNVALEAPFNTHFNSVQCKVAGPIDYAFGTLAFLIPPMVAYNRYLSLYDSQKCTRVFTYGKVFAAWGSALLYCVSFTIPFIITGSVGQDDLGLCGLQVMNSVLAVIEFFNLSLVGVAYAVLLYFSYKVIIKIRNHKKQAFTQRNHQTQLIRESEDIITVMLLLSVIPIFAQVPGCIIKSLQIFIDPLDPWVSRMAIAPYPLTSACNAYITIYVVKEYRKKVARMIGKAVAATVVPEGTAPGASRNVNKCQARIAPIGSKG